MYPDQKFWCTVWVCFFGSIALVFTAILWPIAWHDVATTREAMERGYEEVQIHPNTLHTRWAKVKE